MRTLQGIGASFYYTAALTKAVNASPETRLGQSLGYYFMAFNVAFAVFPSLGIFLVNSFSFTLLFMVCTGLSLCSLSITTQLGRRRVDAALEKGDLKERAFLSRQALPSAPRGLACPSMVWGALTAFLPLYALNQGVANPGLFFTVFAIMIISGRALGERGASDLP